MADGGKKPDFTGPAPAEPAAGLAEVAARLVAGLWLVVACAVALFWPSDAGPVVLAAAVLAPAMAAWALAEVYKTQRQTLAGHAALQRALGSRPAEPAQKPAVTTVTDPVLERRLTEVLRALRQNEAALAALAEAGRAEPVLPPPPPAPAATPVDATGQVAGHVAEEEPSLGLDLGETPAGAPMSQAELIRALNFPDHEDDAEGFAALRVALDDPKWRQLLQAAQDILTLLSQDRVYMDDLALDLPRPELWRRFAAGERGRAVAGLGGVRDRTALVLAAERMRKDTIFRDAAHHFLRRFDQMIVAFEPEADDETLVELSGTRSTRAFMILARVAGIFG